MITYELIIEYLSPTINIFSTPSNIILPFSKFTHFKDIFDDSFYRYGINSLHGSISYCLDSDPVTGSIEEIVNMIHINIIIFDFKNNKISSVYYGDYFNPWRPTIYLANYDKYWEPIISNEEKIFSFSSVKSHILKNKILTDIKKYNDTSQSFCINDNFNEIIELDNLLDNTFINNTTFSKNKLEKMKKDELLQIIINMNIIVNGKPTKKDLIKIICKE
jgi:hypothetical protein